MLLHRSPPGPYPPHRRRLHQQPRHHRPPTARLPRRNGRRS
jgi:hypothetical protein